MKLCGTHLKLKFSRLSGTALTLMAPIVSNAQGHSETQKLAEMVPMASIGQALGNLTDFCKSGTGACMYVLLGAMLIALWAIFFSEVVKPDQEASGEEAKIIAGSTSNMSLAATAGIALLLILAVGIFFAG